MEEGLTITACQSFKALLPTDVPNAFATLQTEIQQCQRLVRVRKDLRGNPLREKYLVQRRFWNVLVGSGGKAECECSECTLQRMVELGSGSLLLCGGPCIPTLRRHPTRFLGLADAEAYSSGRY